MRGAEPWCPACEWNLGRFEPDRRRPELGWLWVDRATHRTAWRLTEREFAALVQRPLDARKWTAPRVLIMVVAVVLLLFVAALAVCGIWLITYDFPKLTILPGVALLALAIALRPRLGGLPSEIHELPESSELAALVTHVAEAIGAPQPHIIGVDDSLGAYTTTIGLRRHRVLVLGLPLWSALTDQEKVALIGHELGHFANGDIRRGPLVHMALTTLGKLSALTRESGTATTVLEIVVAAIQWFFSRIVFLLHLLVVWLGLRDSQRAEYLADELAARAAGTAAAATLFDTLLLHDSLETVITREARARRGLPAWKAAAAEARTSSAPRLPLLRQLSRRDEVSLFASHPPTGMRAAMLQRRPAHPAAVTLTEPRSARIDTELDPIAEQIRRELAVQAF
ncbi:M48 family metalloprotease [Winogradskya humida]|uniref:Peptidase M48 domain-containing protein n=2 Tax=Winogradskya humida TaxID=113566 RepID=A0ABQ3ZK82_9ACTN|nr:hypothetical protein Ahu01nite_020640 [Actinoplanes humidus]